ncbi:hypothetical protein EI94DRAFT_1815765 [Lactarius quietus]|nr:hypothetical protein EI94DRAFT_1815765 [Lactarius quietus]
MSNRDTWEGGDDALEEEMPDEAEEYVEDKQDLDRSPEEAEEYLEAPGEAAEYLHKKPWREAPAWYDEGWCGPWEGGTAFTEQEEPEEAKEYPKLQHAEEWNTRQWEAPTNEPSPWQQQIDARIRCWPSITKQTRRSQWIQAQEEAASGEEPRPGSEERVHLWTYGDQPRCRARAEENPPRNEAHAEESQESLQEAWQRIKRVWNPTKISRQQGRTVRFNVQEESKEFKRGDPPILVRHSSPRLPSSEAGRSSLKGTPDVLCGHKAEERVMLRSDPAQTATTHRQRKCLHEHWKDCHDYPEAHTWETRDQKNIEEEEASPPARE